MNESNSTKAVNKQIIAWGHLLLVLLKKNIKDKDLVKKKKCPVGLNFSILYIF